MTSEFEANLGRVKREEPFYESASRQDYQRLPREEQYLPNTEPTKFKEAFILFFLIIGIITIFVMFGLYLFYISNDKFKDINSNSQNVNLEPKIDVYSTTNNTYQFQTPTNNFYNYTIVINNYINLTTGGNQS